VITRFSDENIRANQPVIDLIRQFAADKKASPAQISLAWMLCREDFIAPIPGSRKPERIRENLGAADIHLDRDEISRLDEALNRISVHGNRTDEDISRLYR